MLERPIQSSVCVREDLLDSGAQIYFATTPAQLWPAWRSHQRKAFQHMSWCILEKVFADYKCVCKLWCLPEGVLHKKDGNKKLKQTKAATTEKCLVLSFVPLGYSRNNFRILSLWCIFCYMIFCLANVMIFFQLLNYFWPYTCYCHSRKASDQSGLLSQVLSAERTKSRANTTESALLKFWLSNIAFYRTLNVCLFLHNLCLGWKVSFFLCSLIQVN